MDTGIPVLVADLQTTLRLADELAADIAANRTSLGPDSRAVQLADALLRQPSLAALPAVLLKTYTGVTAALGGIRLSRETIEVHAVDRLRTTHVKLAEVSSATECAAAALLDGLDRALVMIDRLDTQPGVAGADGQPIQQGLRDELNGLFGVLQFQDITAQQLRAATDLLQDVEQRLLAVASLFDLSAMSSERGPGVAATPAMPVVICPTYDPAATTRNAESRQALADEILIEANASPWQLASR
jgi:hypothetical protein